MKTAHPLKVREGQRGVRGEGGGGLPPFNWGGNSSRETFVGTLRLGLGGAHGEKTKYIKGENPKRLRNRGGEGYA